MTIADKFSLRRRKSKIIKQKDNFDEDFFEESDEAEKAEEEQAVNESEAEELTVPNIVDVAEPIQYSNVIGLEREMGRPSKVASALSIDVV